jgi:hypothetical protein
MLEAIVLLVGAFVAWVAADQFLMWRRDRRGGGPSSWHGRGPGTTFHSTGFEDTLPPHEVTEPAPGARLLKNRR